MRQPKRREPTEIVFCQKCGRADTIRQAKRRKFNEGKSGCCNAELNGFRPRA